MLLSVVSSEDVSVAIVGGNASVPDADVLGRFAVAVCNGVAGDASADRDAALLREQLTARLGVAGMLDCAATVAMFNGINRVADLCGVVIDPLSAPLAEGLLEQLNMVGSSNWDAPPSAHL